MNELRDKTACFPGELSERSSRISKEQWAYAFCQLYRQAFGDESPEKMLTHAEYLNRIVSTSAGD